MSQERVRELTRRATADGCAESVGLLKGDRVSSCLVEREQDTYSLEAGVAKLLPQLLLRRCSLASVDSLALLHRTRRLHRPKDRFHLHPRAHQRLLLLQVQLCRKGLLAFELSLQPLNPILDLLPSSLTQRRQSPLRIFSTTAVLPKLEHLDPERRLGLASDWLTSGGSVEGRGEDDPVEFFDGEEFVAASVERGSVRSGVRREGQPSGGKCEGAELGEEKTDELNFLTTEPGRTTLMRWSLSAISNHIICLSPLTSNAPIVCRGERIVSWRRCGAVAQQRTTLRSISLDPEYICSPRMSSWYFLWCRALDSSHAVSPLFLDMVAAAGVQRELIPLFCSRFEVTRGR